MYELNHHRLLAPICPDAEVFNTFQVFKAYLFSALFKNASTFKPVQTFILLEERTN